MHREDREPLPLFLAENPEKQSAWICRLEQYPQIILNPDLLLIKFKKLVSFFIFAVYKHKKIFVKPFMKRNRFSSQIKAPGFLA